MNQYEGDGRDTECDRNEREKSVDEKPYHCPPPRRPNGMGFVPWMSASRHKPVPTCSGAA
jgi:hypothetical protein